MQSQLTFYNLKSISSRKAFYCILTENQYQIVKTVKQSNRKFVKTAKWITLEDTSMTNHFTDHLVLAPQKNLYGPNIRSF